MIKKCLLRESACIVKEILTEHKQYCGNNSLTRDDKTVLNKSVNCKLCHILCNSDTIICGCIASESEIVSNEVGGMWKEVVVMSLEGMGKTKKTAGQNDIQTGHITVSA